jgi:hypothetical protein
MALTLSEGMNEHTIVISKSVGLASTSTITRTSTRTFNEMDLKESPFV